MDGIFVRTSGKLIIYNVNYIFADERYSYVGHHRLNKAKISNYGLEIIQPELVKY
jgi:hypothetical protein